MLQVGQKQTCIAGSTIGPIIIADLISIYIERNPTGTAGIAQGKRQARPQRSASAWNVSEASRAAPGMRSSRIVALLPYLPLRGFNMPPELGSLARKLVRLLPP